MSNQTGNAHYLVRRGNQNYKVLGSDVTGDCQRGDIFLVNRPSGSDKNYKINYEDMALEYPLGSDDLFKYSYQNINYGQNGTDGNERYAFSSFDYDPVNRMWMIGGGEGWYGLHGYRSLAVTDPLPSNDITPPWGNGANNNTSDWNRLDAYNNWPWNNSYYLSNGDPNPLRHHGIMHIKHANGHWIVRDYPRVWKYAAQVTVAGLLNMNNWNTMSMPGTNNGGEITSIHYIDNKWIIFGTDDNDESYGAVDTSIEFNTSNLDTFSPIPSYESYVDTGMFDMIKDTYNDLYIACGGNVIMTAPTTDMTDWTVRFYSPTLYVNGLATDDLGTILACATSSTPISYIGGNNYSGTQGRILRSTNGINWTELSYSTDEVLGMENLRNIGYHKGAWVACGRRDLYSSSSSQNIIYSRDNGDSWSKSFTQRYNNTNPYGDFPGNTSPRQINEIKNINGHWYAVGVQTFARSGIGTNYGFEDTDFFVASLTDVGISTNYKVAGSDFKNVINEY